MNCPYINCKLRGADLTCDEHPEMCKVYNSRKEQDARDLEELNKFTCADIHELDIRRLQGYVRSRA